MYRRYLFKQARGIEVPVPRSTRYRWMQNPNLSNARDLLLETELSMNERDASDAYVTENVELIANKLLQRTLSKHQRFSETG